MSDAELMNAFDDVDVDGDVDYIDLTDGRVGGGGFMLIRGLGSPASREEVWSLSAEMADAVTDMVMLSDGGEHEGRRAPGSSALAFSLAWMAAALKSGDCGGGCGGVGKVYEFVRDVWVLRGSRFGDGKEKVHYPDEEKVFAHLWSSPLEVLHGCVRVVGDEATTGREAAVIEVTVPLYFGRRLLQSSSSRKPLASAT